MTDCDPCSFCRYISIGYLEEYGYYMDDCKADVEDWEPGCGIPCPRYAPMIVSDYLYEQLYEEDLYKEYMEAAE